MTPRAVARAWSPSSCTVYALAWCGVFWISCYTSSFLPSFLRLGCESRTSEVKTVSYEVLLIALQCWGSDTFALPKTGSRGPKTMPRTLEGDLVASMIDSGLSAGEEAVRLKSRRM